MAASARWRDSKARWQPRDMRRQLECREAAAGVERYRSQAARQATRKAVRHALRGKDTSAMFYGVDARCHMSMRARRLHAARAICVDASRHDVSRVAAMPPCLDARFAAVAFAVAAFTQMRARLRYSAYA